MEKSKVRALQNRCGRKIKAKTANGQNERKEEIRGAREKSQSSYGLWRRRSVLICFQVVLAERISHFVPACLQSKLFVNASHGCCDDTFIQRSSSSAALFCNPASARRVVTSSETRRRPESNQLLVVLRESGEFRDDMTEVRSRVQQHGVLSNHIRFVFPSCGKKSPSPRLR